MQLLDEFDKQYPMQGMGNQYDMYDEMYYDQAAMMQAQQQQQSPSCLDQEAHWSW